TLEQIVTDKAALAADKREHEKNKAAEWAKLAQAREKHDTEIAAERAKFDYERASFYARDREAMLEVKGHQEAAQKQKAELDSREAELEKREAAFAKKRARLEAAWSE